MNEKICMKKVLDSPNVYFPELEQYIGEDIEMTITITVDRKNVSVIEDKIDSRGCMRVTYQNDDDDGDDYVFFCPDEECSFEMT